MSEWLTQNVFKIAFEGVILFLGESDHSDLLRVTLLYSYTTLKTTTD